MLTYDKKKLLLPQATHGTWREGISEKIKLRKMMKDSLKVHSFQSKEKIPCNNGKQIYNTYIDDGVL